LAREEQKTCIVTIHCLDKPLHTLCHSIKTKKMGIIVGIYAS